MTPDLISRLERPGPRHTSYPTADRFVEAFGADQYREALRARRHGAARHGGAPLSVYVHIPFCESVCYYCACNKVVTRRHERATTYLDAIESEIALHEAELSERVPVSQLHLGGGTPTFLSDDELTRLMQMLRRAFAFAPLAELAIEVDPRTADVARLAHLARRGCLSAVSEANAASSATRPRDRASQGSRSEAQAAPAKRGSLPARAFAAPITKRL